MSLHSRLLAASLTLALSACADMGHIAPQSAMLDPNSLQAGKAIDDASAAAIAWPRALWWQDLQDPQLNQLMQQALADSPTLRGAQARVRQAEALAGAAEEKTRPQGQADVSINRELYSGNGTTPAPLAGNYAWRNQATVSASYDLDLWGHNRAALAAALGDVQLASAESQMARLTLETALVRTYIQLSYQFTLQDVIERSLAQRAHILDITQRRRQAGIGTDVDVAQIETTLPAGRRQLEQSTESLALLRNQLAALSGKGPAAGAALTRPVLRLDRPLAIPKALPADLIGRRPDIAAQRWRVEAAARRIDAAKAEFYPNVNLVAFAGLQSFGFDKFLDINSQIRGVTPALSLPIFAGARLRAQLGNQTAIYDGAVEQYNATVIQAMSDVANAVTSAQSLQKQNELTRQALATAQRTRDLAEKAYKAGMSDAINMLNAQVALLAEDQQQAQNGARELDLYVSLMNALGGGIETHVADGQQADQHTDQQDTISALSTVKE
ncbi:MULTISPECIES: efflux transporter outer membrane subunit [unclassified Janthinobacterium]|uniref:efflux transporter outer membrane subunit n=1 Tax=unclassified Janthinobacterium TaxID=2610881 RepID=UPI0016133CDD|nr:MULTISPECIES: efflux transporter outer membrane subunit [unclassified Janthinobacterium]MBB5369684.1 NodT family efflux transporter outer membrane factor (OMF) lipoprotein [Janthinobacterium sp. K2C7]MBB5382360.1 NodT family efflux transporter outer membrane factor (OMF) lipoprotein [Janthinobacterium sp. K2Li3]MBB5387937.1 NodT family efflux transporter outer membrane factor (OMF) lipoprotein [Janthinobacterium sp. K2E3]